MLFVSAVLVYISVFYLDMSDAIQETPVQSVISEPVGDAVIQAEDEYVTVKGYAFSGGGRGIFRVDVSLDGGKTWVNPQLDNNGKNYLYLI